jgi:hypothetical protein
LLVEAEKFAMHPEKISNINNNATALRHTGKWFVISGKTQYSDEVSIPPKSSIARIDLMVCFSPKTSCKKEGIRSCFISLHSHHKLTFAIIMY